jgi:serine/threonine protein phosphatase PrpC
MLSAWLLHPRRASAALDIPELGAALGTEIGLVRQENQDRVVVARFNFADKSREDFAVAVLCDGVGGVANGGRSADLAMSEIVAFLSMGSRVPLSTRLVEAITSANKLVHETFPGSGGTTIVAILISESTIFAASVGDSRIYAFTGQKLLQISVDDTIANEVSRVSGDEAAKALPDALSRSLAQYVGMGEGIEPRLYRFPANSVEAFILTSDGAHNWPTESLSTLYTNAPNPQTFVTRLLALSRWVGGQDNASIIAIAPSRIKPIKPSEMAYPGLTLWDAFGRVDFIDAFIKAHIDAHVPAISEPGITPEPTESRPRNKSRQAGRPKQKSSRRKTDQASKDKSQQRVLHIELSAENQSTAPSEDTAPSPNPIPPERPEIKQEE